MVIIKKIWNLIAHDSMRKNALFLLASSVANAGFGFIFWKLNASLYTPTEVGLATALITSAQLITNISMLGLPQAIIKVLPASKQVNHLAGEVMIITFTTSILIASIFCMVSPLLAPEVATLLLHPQWAIVFVLLTGITGVNTLTDSILIAKRRSDFVFYEYTISGIAKMILIFVCMGLGSAGIFVAANSSYLIALIVTFICFAIIKIYPRGTRKFLALKEIRSFATKNYIAALLGGSITLMLPLLITRILSPADAAYYYMVFMIAGLVSLVPTATTNSLYAELSNDKTNLSELIKHSIKTTFVLLIPIVAIGCIFSSFILSVFGEEYSNAGESLLKLYLIAALFIAIKNICGSYLRVFDGMKYFIIVELLTALLTITLSIFMMEQWGLLGLGYAWLVTHAVTAIMFCYLSFRHNTNLNK